MNSSTNHNNVAAAGHGVARFQFGVGVALVSAVVFYLLGRLTGKPPTPGKVLWLAGGGGFLIGAWADFWARLLTPPWRTSLLGALVGGGWAPLALWLGLAGEPFYLDRELDLNGEVIGFGTLLGAVLGLVSGMVLLILAEELADHCASPTSAPAPAEGESPRRRCGLCGRHVLDGALLRPLPATSSPRKKYACGRCHARRQRRDELATRVEVLVLLAAIVATVVLFPSEPAGWVALNVALFLVFYQLLIVPHELGHALGAWLTAGRLFRVHIGFGLMLFDGRRWGLRRDQWPTPRGYGFALAGYREPHHLRLRVFVHVLGGPLANALLLGIALWWLPPGGFFDRLGEVKERLLPWHAFALANVFALAVSLWPYRLQEPDGQHESDGWQLLTLPFSSPEYPHQAQVQYFLLEADVCLDHKEFAEARRWCERLLERYPEDTFGRSYLASLLLREREFLKARQLWRDLSAGTDLDATARILELDAQATADLLLLLDGTRTLQESTEGHPTDLLEEADRLTLEAVAEGGRVPSSIPSFLGTRGGVLIERGNFEEGEELLRGVIEETEEASIQATCTCYLALAAARRGDGEAAGKHLETARALDPESPFLEGATRQVSQPQARGTEVALG